MSVWFLLFLAMVTILFFLLPKKLRPTVLLVASYVFCGFIEIRALVVLILIASAAWIWGIAIERAHQKKHQSAARVYLVLALVVCVLILCSYKYLAYLLQRLGWEERLTQEMLVQLLIPVGLSFYLFQVISYLVDIYQKKISSEKNFILCSLYFAFFAKFISGPIERADSFISSLKSMEDVKFWNRGRLSTAATYMLWGYFMKMVIADRLAVSVRVLFETPQEFDSFWLILGAFLYTVQIYCDFAGYSYIAIGVAKIFGLDLVQNFTSPYCATSVIDFWRRWHISLSSWLRDYVYIPLGGNRKGILRKCLNTMLVFLVCGMWHGAGLNFIVWGLLHGCFVVYEAVAKSQGWKVYGGRILTFLAVAFAWIFFRASNLRSALTYVKQMFTAGLHTEHMLLNARKLQLNSYEVFIIVAGIMLMWIMDEICNRKKMHVPYLIQQKPNVVRYLIFYLLLVVIFVFGVYGPGYHVEQFIYMQF